MQPYKGKKLQRVCSGDVGKAQKRKPCMAYEDGLIGPSA